MKAKVHITLKNGVLDPQGKAVQHALSSLGFGGVNDVRQGKFIELELDETDPAKAKASVEQMCKNLLANTVIGPDGTQHSFAMEADRREALLLGRDDIAATLEMSEAITAFQKADRLRRPWVWGTMI